MNRHSAATDLRHRAKGSDVLHGALGLRADFGGSEFGAPQHAALVLYPPAQLCGDGTARQGNNRLSADLPVSLGNAEGGYRRLSEILGIRLPFNQQEILRLCRRTPKV